MNETTAIVCPHVFHNDRPIKIVIYHKDGVWQLVCGATDHLLDCSDFEVVGLEHLISRQDNLYIIYSIGKGALAEWDGQHWSISEFEE